MIIFKVLVSTVIQDETHLIQVSNQIWNDRNSLLNATF